MNQTDKVLSFLNSGRELTAAQARGLFGVQNLAARIHEIRSEGYPVYTNVLKNGGTGYRLGKASKRMVALAYQVVGSQVFKDVA